MQHLYCGYKEESSDDLSERGIGSGRFFEGGSYETVFSKEPLKRLTLHPGSLRGPGNVSLMFYQKVGQISPLELKDGPDLDVPIGFPLGYFFQIVYGELDILLPENGERG